MQEDQGFIFSDKQDSVVELLESPECQHITEIFYGGAAGGGKTFLISHWQIERRLKFPGTRGLIGRASLKNLMLTTFNTFSDIWHKYYSDNPFGVTWRINGSTNVMKFSNGSEIIWANLSRSREDPEYHRLGSLEITDACIDELPEIEEKAFDILQSRIRYRLIGGAPKILATGNPSPNWVKARYVKSIEGDPVTLKPHQRFVKATVHDNPDESFKKVYISSLEKLPPKDRVRLLDGEWDVIINDDPFFYSFNREKHYKPIQYELKPEFPLDISFDFNKDPCTAIVGQYEPHLPRWNFIRSHYASPIDNKSSLQVLCEDIERTYFKRVNRYNINITGDASGGHGSSDRAANVNRYTQIAGYLGVNKSTIKVERQNLNHVASRDLCNAVLLMIDRGHFVFWAGTEKLIENIEASYPDTKGTLNKAKEDLGLHDVDCFRYMVKYWFAHKLNGTKLQQYQVTLKNIQRRITAQYESRTKVA